MNNLNNDKVAKYISSRLSLRKPQNASLDILISILNKISLSKEIKLEDTLEDFKKLFPNFQSFGRDFPSICFSIATGVGKTRLMAAFISYFYLKHNRNNFFILAPNLTIYEKLKNDFDPKNSKYVFKGISEITSIEPQVITAEDYKSGSGVSLDFKPPGSQSTIYDLKKNIYINIFNVDKINSSRIKEFNEHIGQSYFDYLTKLDDLVLFMDEAHRYYGSAGLKSINKLNPLIGIELTATPKISQSKDTLKNIVYTYNLANAMSDGYVKEPAVATLKNFNPKNISTDQLEIRKIKDAITYHEQLKLKIDIYSRDNNKKKVKPFILVVCKDTNHANKVFKLIESKQFYNGRYIGKTNIIHSQLKKEESDENIFKLTSIENYTEPTEILIHVNKLKEGWDVNNLFTIVPLRASASEILTEQTLGRGLRLPYSRRTGEEIIDTLTVIAHDKFQDIVDEAQKENSIIKKSIEIGDDGEIYFDQDKSIESLPVYQNYDEQELSRYILESIKTTDLESLESSSQLNKKSNINIITSKINESVGVNLINNKLNKVEDIVKDIINKIIDIPSIYLRPSKEVNSGIKNFDLENLSEININPVDNEILIKQLRTNKNIIISALVEDNKKLKEKKLSDYLVKPLSEKNLIDYEDNSDLLYKLAGQLITRLKQYLKTDNEIENVLIHYNNQLIDFIYSQILKNYWEKIESYTVEFKKGFHLFKTINYKIDKNDRPLNFLKIPENKNQIKKLVFTGFKKCCYKYQKFDSVDGELRFAHILEQDNNVIKWLKSYDGLIDIEYKIGKKYKPDFIIETHLKKYICEIKREDEIKADDVKSKTKATIEWCHNANKISKKKWSYILIPHNETDSNNTFDSLVKKYSLS